MMGAYILPADERLSANYEHRSGDVFARQVRFTSASYTFQSASQCCSVRLQPDRVWSG
jgi:hypothetical protein